MGSIGDYGQRRRSSWRSFNNKSRWNKNDNRENTFVQRLLRQGIAAAILLLLVAAGIDGENLLGQGARYVVQSASGSGDSWINQQDEPEENPNTEIKQDNPVIDDSVQPVFTAPASGVVVTDVTASSQGESWEQGLLIQGNENQQIKATADGIVELVSGQEGDYMLKLSHSGGFSSIYQGISSVSVTQGQTVYMGEVLGSSQSGEITFSLLLDGLAVDPLEYLFQ